MVNPGGILGVALVVVLVLGSLTLLAGYAIRALTCAYNKLLSSQTPVPEPSLGKAMLIGLGCLLVTALGIFVVMTVF